MHFVPQKNIFVNYRNFEAALPRARFAYDIAPRHMVLVAQTSQEA